MSMPSPESSLFDQLDDASPVGLANTMFFEATEDYLAAIRIGLSVSRDSQPQACKDIGRKAELMSSAAQMLALKLHGDNPNTAADNLADALYTNERMQYALFKPLVVDIKARHDPRGAFLGSIQESLDDEGRASDGTTREEALSHAAREVLLLNTHTWVRTLRKYGVTSRDELSD